ncbi:MAG: hypothetical protein KCHDKBKB_02666 [Elusimicrobia bacterium]|nr:hypothetical protein [Elusimicrobiota bacterium]
MSKKNKQSKVQPIGKNSSDESRPTLISKRGWRVIGVGIGLLIMGYFVLSKADAMAQNWAGHIAPFLILGGYATIGWGIIIKDPSPPSQISQTNPNS